MMNKKIMKRKSVLVFILFSASVLLYGQNEVSGRILDEASKLPIEYVNIGIFGKNVGTVSDRNGKFNLLIEPQYQNDSLLFSCIGYEPYAVKISDIRPNEVINLQEKSYFLDEVVVNPRIFRERVLGITTKSRYMGAGFENNRLGYECGLMMNVKKTAVIKTVKVNVSACDYDSIFYRLNIYEVRGEYDFENILREPIYVSASKEDILKNGLQVDLGEKDIIVSGDFVVALEHVRNLGNAGIWFCASMRHESYYRKTSQGNWTTLPVGISISVVADVEK